MGKAFWILIAIILLSLALFSLSFADFSNYAGPQLEYISNAFPLLWNKSQKDILSMMSIFPDYICTDYADQIACKSKFNTNQHDNIFLNFFTDDYEEHHDNLWKVAVSVDLKEPGQVQDAFSALWLDGMKPFHSSEDEFYEFGVQVLYFDNEVTSMVTYFQPFKSLENNPYFLVEYYNGYMR